MQQQKTILPPQCIGIIGGGQLGRMLAIAAKQMGYRVATLEPDSDCPAKHFADVHIIKKYDDQDGLDALAQVSDVITTEFENVPAQCLEYLSNSVATHPSAASILISQNRLLEKKFFNDNGVPTAEYMAIRNLEDIKGVGHDMFPAILKTTTLGYDGKGQVLVQNTDELYSAFSSLEQVECILEKLVDLKSEVSIILARNSHGVCTYPINQNIHKNGILDYTISPANISSELAEQIIQMGINIINALNYIGVLTIEFFISNEGKILANEMAPRPHNSGHHTIDANCTSQFEQQLRSVCNLKLGATNSYTNAIMINLMGDIWTNINTPPDFSFILSKFDNIKLHLYNKLTARPGRKMGHLTILGDDIEELTTQLLEIKQILKI